MSSTYFVANGTAIATAGKKGRRKNPLKYHHILRATCAIYSLAQVALLLEVGVS